MQLISVNEADKRPCNAKVSVSEAVEVYEKAKDKARVCSDLVIGNFATRFSQHQQQVNAVLSFCLVRKNGLP